MKTAFTLPCAMRVFLPVGVGLLLGNTSCHLDRGDKIEIFDLEARIYDHSDKLAIPFMWGGKKHYLLVEEVDDGLRRISYEWHDKPAERTSLKEQIEEKLRKYTSARLTLVESC